MNTNVWFVLLLLSSTLYSASIKALPVRTPTAASSVSIREISSSADDSDDDIGIMPISQASGQPSSDEEFFDARSAACEPPCELILPARERKNSQVLDSRRLLGFVTIRGLGFSKTGEDEAAAATPPVDFVDLPPDSLSKVAYFLPAGDLRSFKNTCKTTRVTLKGLDPRKKRSLLDYMVNMRSMRRLMLTFNRMKESWPHLDILYAVKCGNLSRAADEIDKGGNINAIDEDGNSLLMIATKKGYHPIVESLLAHGADFRGTDDRGHTPLLCASAMGNSKAVRMLLNAGASTAVKDQKGQTALMLAAMKGYRIIVKSLLDAGADVTPQDTNGLNAMTWALSSGHRSIIRDLVTSGAHEGLSDEDKAKAIELASHRGEVLDLYRGVF